MNLPTQGGADSASERRSARSDFGVFYPVGYIVVGFPDEADALAVQHDLMTGGYDEADCTLHRAREVAEAASRNLRDNDTFFGTLGKSDDAVRMHLQAAEKGASFLLIYAPGDLETERAMTVVRRKPFVFAHRYHRFVIQDMK